MTAQEKAAIEKFAYILTNLDQFTKANIYNETRPIVDDLELSVEKWHGFISLAMAIEDLKCADR